MPTDSIVVVTQGDVFLLTDFKEIFFPDGTPAIDTRQFCYHRSKIAFSFLDGIADVRGRQLDVYGDGKLLCQIVLDLHGDPVGRTTSINSEDAPGAARDELLTWLTN